MGTTAIDELLAQSPSTLEEEAQLLSQAHELIHSWLSGEGPRG
ncbi:MAG: hypothetical protein Q3962_01970 [Corynebacterium sp.]|nr:hypothetical protein [Corynebacterium sp.]